MSSRFLSPFRTASFSIAALLGSQVIAAEWLGTANSDFVDPANWIDAAPLPKRSNDQVLDLKVLNERRSPLRYTAENGNTRIGSPSAGSGQFLVGFEDRSGRLEIAGGSLYIYSYWSPIVAQNGRNTTGVIHVNGGVLNIANTSRTKPHERFFRVGNTGPNPADLRANGAIFISGGVLTIECEGGSDTGSSFIAGGLNVGRCNGSGLIYLTGGRLTVTSPHGTSFVPDNGKASGVLTFALGDGVFEQTNSNRLTFGTHPESDSYITFQPGSAGALSLAGATRETFDQLIRDGHIRIEGALADISRFSFTQEGPQGVLRLASAGQK